MVTYELVMREGDMLAYSYWPDGDRSAECGTITVDLMAETARLAKPAERDFRGHATGADLNAMRDDINRMRMERGERPLPEEELPIEPDDAVYEPWVYYGYALRDISRKHDDGLIPERGIAMWY